LGSAARDRLGLTRDAGGSDRHVAALLSALAEAPDCASAVSFLLTQLAEIAGVRRAYALVLQGEGVLRPLVHVGFKADEPRPTEQSTDDLDNPLAIATLSLLPVTGTSADLRHGAAFAPWIALPMPRPHYRGAPKPLPLQQARERLAVARDAEIAVARLRHAVATPGGLIVLEGGVATELVEDLADIAFLAGPVVMRLEALDDAQRRAGHRQPGAPPRDRAEQPALHLVPGEVDDGRVDRRRARAEPRRPG
jgi:hypothetical protein